MSQHVHKTKEKNFRQTVPDGVLGPSIKVVLKKPDGDTVPRSGCVPQMGTSG